MGSLPDSVGSDGSPLGLPALQCQTLGEAKEVLVHPIKKNQGLQPRVNFSGRLEELRN